jgi:hypothetical protein
MAVGRGPPHWNRRKPRMQPNSTRAAGLTVQGTAGRRGVRSHGSPFFRPTHCFCFSFWNKFTLVLSICPSVWNLSCWYFYHEYLTSLNSQNHINFDLSKILWPVLADITSVTHVNLTCQRAIYSSSWAEASRASTTRPTCQARSCLHMGCTHDPVSLGLCRAGLKVR